MAGARTMVVACLCTVLAGFQACTSPADPPRAVEERVQLAPELRLERQITAGRPYELRFDLPAGRLLDLAVHQQGIDLVVFLFDPGGELLFEIDSPTRGQGAELVLVVTPSSGEYRLRTEPFSAAAEGAFVLEVRSLRQAAPGDLPRATAAAALARAERRRLAEDFEGAAQAYAQALPALEATGDAPALAEARWHYGEALVEIGRLAEAQRPLEAAAREYQALKDGLGQARVLNDLGALWRELGETERALDAHRRSLALYREVGVARGEATALNNLGLVLETQGNLDGAASLYEEALVIWRREDRPLAEAGTLQNLGSLYALIGRDDEALDLLQQAADRLAVPGQERKRVSALIALGWAHYLAGQPDNALALYDEALGLARELGDPLKEAAVLDRQGTALRALGRLEEAASSYHRALELCRAAGSELSEGHTLANLGWLDLLTGEVAAARSRLRRAGEILADVGDPNGEVYARVGLARAERQRGDLEAAQRHLEAALLLMEEVRSEVPGALSRSYFLAVRYDFFEELVSVLMERSQRDEDEDLARRALEVVELARARGLLEGLPAASARQPPPEDGAESRRRKLLAEIRALEARRMKLAAEEPRSPRLPQLERSLRGRSLELERLEAAGESRASGSPSALDFQEIQALLDADTLLLVYFLAEPESYLWTVDRQGVQVHRLAGRKELENGARRVATLLARSREVALRNHALEAARGLSQEVLGPVAGRLAGWKRIVVVADGALHYVPFAALPAPSAAGGAPQEMLLERHEIVALPSASVLAHQRRALAHRPRPAHSVAVLADPVFTRADDRSPGGPAVGPGLPADLERAFQAVDLRRLGRLPFSAQEADAIAELVPAGQRLRATGYAATRQLAESGVLRDYRILHFATHGLLHPTHPGLSGVVLSLIDEEGQSQDGFLRAHEVAALDLPADLVVLSACRTALGQEIRGEGLVGLTQAFFQAGAQRVVVSHWNVNDLATAELMRRFYQGLLVDRLPAAAALRKAQLSILREDRWSAPYFWAAFSLQGEWR